MSQPANLKVDNGSFFDSVGDDSGIAYRMKCIAPIGYGDVTAANWDPSFTTAINLWTFQLDDGTTVDPDANLSSGTIVIADTDTMAILLAKVNATTYWRMVLVAAVPADLIQTGGSIDLVDLTSDKDCATEVGSAAKWDVSVTEEMNNVIGIENAGIGFGAFTARHTELTAPKSGRETPDKVSAPAEIFNTVERTNFITKIIVTVTYTGAVTVKVWGVSPAGVVRVMHSQAAAATTVALTITFTDPLVARPGERIIVNAAGADLTAVTLLSVWGGWGRLLR